MAWDSTWLAAMNVITHAQKVFAPDKHPPSDLIPLVEPLITLRKALQSQDLVEVRRASALLVADDAPITWACSGPQSKEIHEFGFMLAYLAKVLAAGQSQSADPGSGGGG